MAPFETVSSFSTTKNRKTICLSIDLVLVLNMESDLQSVQDRVEICRRVALITSCGMQIRSYKSTLLVE